MSKIKQSLVLNDSKKLKYKDNVLWLLLRSKKNFGKRAGDVLNEWKALNQGFGQISFQEYIHYRLYDDSLSFDEKRRFVSDMKHWLIIDKCSPPDTNKVLTEDKQKTYDYLTDNGIPVPKTYRIIPSQISPYDTPHLKCESPEDTKEFLNGDVGFPLFAKPNFGIASLGAFAITEAKEDGVIIAETGQVSYSDLFHKFFSNEIYLLQESVKNHSDLQIFSQYLATIRVANIIKDGDVHLQYALIKIPSTKNIADNYWRDGNTLAEIDLKTGKLLKVVTGRGSKVKDIENHPDTGETMIGFQLPYWKEALALNQKTSSLFPEVTYQSLDIAITPDGPVIIEVNRGGSFELPQLVRRKGILTDEMKAFIESHGVGTW